MKKNNVIAEKSKGFALRMIRLYRFLTEEKHEYILSRQMLRSGTSIGANVREAARAQTDADFYSKLTIALKEADETAYWLELLHQTHYIDDDTYSELTSQCKSIRAMLVASCRTAKTGEQNEK